MKKTCEHTEWTDKRLISDAKIIIGGGWSDANVRITVRCPMCHEKLSMVTGCFGGVTISISRDMMAPSSTTIDRYVTPDEQAALVHAFSLADAAGANVCYS